MGHAQRTTEAERHPAAPLNTASTADLSPEFRLVLRCLRWPVTAADGEAIRADASAVRNWHGVLAIARRHRVVAMVWKALSQTGVTPPAVAATFQQAALAAARQALLLATESGRLSSLLQEASIDALFMKGTAVALLAYGDLSVRHAKDIDILVQDANALDRAMALLRRSGYRPGVDLDTVDPERRLLWFRRAKSLEWMHEGNGIEIELHWRLTDLPLLHGAGATRLVRAVPLSAKTSLRTLAPDALLAYLCVHGAAHGWMRLKWLADVYALLPHDPVACDETYRRLLALGAGRAAGQALLLCHALLGLELTPHLLETLAGDPLLRLSRSMAFRRFAPPAEAVEVTDLRFGTASVYCSRLLSGNGLRGLLQEARTWAYQPEDLLTTRLPRWLWFTHPLWRTCKWLATRVRYGGRSAPVA